MNWFIGLTCQFSLIIVGIKNWMKLKFILSILLIEPTWLLNAYMACMKRVILVRIISVPWFFRLVLFLFISYSRDFPEWPDETQTVRLTDTQDDTYSFYTYFPVVLLKGSFEMTSTHAPRKLSKIGCAHPSHQCASRKKSLFKQCGITIQSKEGKTFGHILASVQRNLDLNSFGKYAPFVWKTCKYFSGNCEKCAHTFHRSADCVNPKS